MVAGLLRVLTVVHRTGHRVLRGRVGSRYPGRAELVFVRITGRRTGRVHEIPLLAQRDGESGDAAWVVAGSNGGQQEEPQWSRNLRVHARQGRPAEIDAHGTVIAVTVEHVVDAAEHDRLYQLLIDAWPLFQRYRSRVSRAVPVFRLTPAPPSAAPPSPGPSAAERSAARPATPKRPTST